uniref:IF rod domain-containing protein n=1 Tax=Scophthalmus maximus TaxID=52904 RepID=A0A8D3A5Z2_SCOMX
MQRKTCSTTRILCLPWLRVSLKTNPLSPHCSSLLLARRVLTALMFLGGGGGGGGAAASLYISPGYAASLSWCSAKTLAHPHRWCAEQGGHKKKNLLKLKNIHILFLNKQPRKIHNKKFIMSYDSFFSYRLWDSYRGSRTAAKSSMPSSLYPSRAPPSGKRIVRLASSSLPDGSERMNLAQTSSLNTELLGLRSQEREQLVDLNDRFATYIEKVRHLEQQNRALLAELEGLRKWQNDPSRLQALYDGEVRSLRAAIDSESGEKMQMEAERDYLHDVYEQMKERFEEEARRRMDAEEALQRAKEEASRAVLSNCDVEATVVSLCDEMVFLKKVFAEEQAELQTQLQMANISVDVEVSRPDLSTALRDIRTQYERLASKNMQAAEDWYKSKFASVAEMASKNNEAVHAIREETMEYRRLLQTRSSEIEALRNVINSLNKQLEDLEETQTKDVAKYQVNEGHLDAGKCALHWLRSILLLVLIISEPQTAAQGESGRKDIKEKKMNSIIRGRQTEDILMCKYIPAAATPAGNNCRLTAEEKIWKN